MLACVQVSEYRWRRRVVVTGYRGQGHGGQGIFQFHMVRRRSSNSIQQLVFAADD